MVREVFSTQVSADTYRTEQTLLRTRHKVLSEMSNSLRWYLFRRRLWSSPLPCGGMCERKMSSPPYPLPPAIGERANSQVTRVGELVLALISCSAWESMLWPLSGQHTSADTLVRGVDKGTRTGELTAPCLPRNWERGHCTLPGKNSRGVPGDVSVGTQI